MQPALGTKDLELRTLPGARESGCATYRYFRCLRADSILRGMSFVASGPADSIWRDRLRGSQLHAIRHQCLSAASTSRSALSLRSPLSSHSFGPTIPRFVAHSRIDLSHGSGLRQITVARRRIHAHSTFVPNSHLVRTIALVPPGGVYAHAARGGAIRGVMPQCFRT
jgi:hypothetical protein